MGWFTDSKPKFDNEGMSISGREAKRRHKLYQDEATNYVFLFFKDNLNQPILWVDKRGSGTTFRGKPSIISKFHLEEAEDLAKRYSEPGGWWSDESETPVAFVIGEASEKAAWDAIGRHLGL